MCASVELAKCVLESDFLGMCVTYRYIEAYAIVSKLYHVECVHGCGLCRDIEVSAKVLKLCHAGCVHACGLCS